MSAILYIIYYKLYIYISDVYIMCVTWVSAIITNNKTKRSVCVCVYVCMYVCGKFPSGLIRKTVRVTGLVFSV